jgi:hypothetical protein
MNDNKNILSFILYIMNSIVKNVQTTVKTHHIIAIVGFLVLGVALYQYSTGKDLINDNMDVQTKFLGGKGPSNVAQPANPQGQNEQYASVSNMSSGNAAATSDPKDLLPKDQNSEWAKLNPNTSNDLANVNLLKSGYHIGIDTIGNTLRNANLQLRSEPPNPTTKVSPWLQSTIEPDLMRVPMEIGSGAQ